MHNMYTAYIYTIVRTRTLTQSRVEFVLCQNERTIHVSE